MKRLLAVLWWIVSLGAGLFGILSVYVELNEPSLWLGILALASLIFTLAVNPLFVRKIQIRHKQIVMRAIAVGALVAGIGSLISVVDPSTEPLAQEAAQVQNDEEANQSAATDSEDRMKINQKSNKPSEIQEQASAAGVANAQDFTIILNDTGFHPQNVEVQAGKKITLTVQNMTDKVAEFESDDLDREKVVASHTQIEVEIDPLTAGIYKFDNDFHAETKGTMTAK